jgi:hypothetical protein
MLVAVAMLAGLALALTALPIAAARLVPDDDRSCELCLSPRPVDCIAMVARSG